MSAFVVYSAAATEPVTVAEAKKFARIDSGAAEQAPDAPTVTLGSGAGNVDNGAHRYQVTFVTADGETEGGTLSSAVTVADKGVNGKVELTAIPLGGAAVTSRKLYRTIAGGSTCLYLATIANNTATTYSDNIADSGLGASVPLVNTTEDPTLVALIAAARTHAQHELGRYLVTQTVDLYLDAFPVAYAEKYGDGAVIFLPPILSVSAITYVDADGATQTLDSGQYLVDANSVPARVEPSYGNSWPATREQANAVKVRFVAGYGAAAAVPASVRNWMLMRIKTMWENRDQIVVGASGMIQLPSAYVDSLLDSERVHGRWAL